MKRKKKQPTLTRKVVVAWMVVLAISNLIIAVISYTLYRSQLMSARADEARNVAVAMAERIDGEKFSDIMETLEKNDYWHEVKNYADRIAVVFGTAYIYILDADYSDEVTYFAEGAVDEAPFDLGSTEEIEGIYADEMFDTIRTGTATYTEPYPSGEYGDMVSGFAAIRDSGGGIVGVVGVDFYYGDIQSRLNMFALALSGVTVAFLVGCYFLMNFLGKKLAGNPLSELDVAARQLSVGDMNVNLNIRSSTEIGRLAQSFGRMVEAMREQVGALEVLSRGDLTTNIEARGEKDIMGSAITQILNNLNNMFGEIHQAATQVAGGARMISDNAQLLARGASEQAGAVDVLNESFSRLSGLANENLELATETNSLTASIKSDAQTGSEHMNKMTVAVKDIADASVSINKVIKVIDDIAFQTNILALNAAVEAARAGQHGKGFAVVAEEVRNLAAKSAEAAKDTERLISNSMEKARYGATIADETAGSLARIIQGVNECAVRVGSIAGSYEKQIDVITQINKGIGQVSQVVSQNNTAARESAAASEQMRAQAEILEELVSNFKLKGQDGFGRTARPLPGDARRPGSDGGAPAYGGDYGKY